MSDSPHPIRTLTAPDLHSTPSEPDKTAPSSGRSAGSWFGPPESGGEIGTLGAYRVVKELGRGGMGAVYLAYDTRLNRKLALKVMLPELVAQVESRERFLREARAAAQVQHDNVVTVYGVEEWDGVPYIAMQFLLGLPLDEYLRKKGVPGLEHSVRIVREAALGLSAAHAQGLVHRDIKPANLWLEAPNGRVKLLDFGLAKAVSTESDVTKSGAILGTPSHMSPEQARGLRVDHRTDVFSLGTVLYRLCAGQNPFVGEHVMAVLTALAVEEPKPIRELNPKVTAPLADLIHQMLAKKPEARPQTALEVAERLRTVLIQPDISSDERESRPKVVRIDTEPLQVDARESEFAHLLDDTDRTEREVGPNRKPLRRARLLLIASAIALAVIAAVAVALETGSNKPDPSAKSQTPATPPAPPAPVQKPKDVERPPVNPKPGDTFDVEIAAGTKMRFCWVPPGECQMGSPQMERMAAARFGKSDEAEDVRGTFKSKGFWMGKCEVTQAEWDSVMRGSELEAPSAFRIGGRHEGEIFGVTTTKQFPVETVTWNHCQGFLKRANAHRANLGSKFMLDLPEEDEWEYACRGGLGNGRPFHFGAILNGLLANCNGNLPFGTTTPGNALNRPAPVGTYESLAAHPWGLCDMHGNVWEWTKSRAANSSDSRIARGGSYFSAGEECRSARRDSCKATSNNCDLGFRLILTRQ